jgi:hypothetical protein
MNLNLIALMILSSFMAVSACAETSLFSDKSGQLVEKSKFIIEDYASYEQFRKIIPEVFPEGTTKEDVDDIMVVSNHMNHFVDYKDISGYNRIKDGEKLVRYTKMHYTNIECKFIVVAIFNKEDILRWIKGYYGCTGP